MAQNELRGLFSAADLSRPEAVRDALVEVVPLLVREYGELAATVAAEWYESVHPGTFLAQTARDTFPEAGVVENVRYHAGALFTDDPAAALTGLSGAMQRFVFYSGRNTVARNVQLDPERPRFARVPSGAHTCAWCSLLASRGFEYMNQKTAGLNDHYHDDCDCQIVAEWDRDRAHIDGYDPDRLYEMYQAAREAAPAASDKAIAAKMRRLFPGEFTDSVTAA
ncbi:VG15 protein [Microbacterium sp. KNMS]